ncbi:hypothetical protein [Burkholderia ubonensis]|nr:hypothetical protein [Burkholderia ubonensis]
MAYESAISIVKVLRVAATAKCLSPVAIHIREALRRGIEAGICSSLSLSFHDSSTDVALNFAISTPHGMVECVFDQAFKDDELVGRYRFFTIEALPSDRKVASEVWAILFTEGSEVTLDTSSSFAWSIDINESVTMKFVENCLVTLHAKLQANLPRY